MDFLSILLQNLEEDPTDPFNHYSLAIHFQKTDLHKSLQYFETLLLNFSEYLPSYYQAAIVYENLENIQKAKDTLEKGIILAEKQNKDKTKKELETALQNLIFEYDLY